MEKKLNKTEGKKILIIEDQQIFIEMFGDKLKQDGFQVTSAKNGAWGIKEALSKDFDLLVIDMVMPAMNGEEIVAKLKMEEKTKNLPIIIISASVDEETQKRVEQMGIEAFFIKTRITPSDLSRKIQEILK
ncbi:MAG: response regulator [Candidatus Moranbacteria bacterium]|nr:response regulator [Candidatus Moranbacteria bacterium]